MVTWLRLAWRLQRWEVAAAALACLGLAGLATWQAIEMRSALVGCGTAAASAACGFVYPFQASNGTAVQLLNLGMGLAPFAVGLVLGVPLVAGELEHGTSRIAWPLARSRARWLAWRALPVMGLTVVGLGLAAVASDAMVQAYQPKTEIGFLQFGARGVPMVLRGVCVLVIGIAVGATVGRLLPALLVSIALVVGLHVGLDEALDHWLPSARIGDDASLTYDGSLVTEVRYRAPDGSLIGDEEASAIWERNSSASPGDEVVLDVVPYGLGPDRYWEVVLREGALLAGLAATAGGFALVVVRRRRPG
jgi:hypothetical protein